MTLHRHQVDAIRAARDDRNYVLTTGTGSGKSLSYIIPIVDHVLRTGSGKGVKAIVVYPMNALANSQKEELDKFLGHGPWGHRPPVTYRRYTGQENDEERQEIRQNPPDIILTNYVMLELVLTRYLDRRLVGQLGDLRFLVLDELHTYRGRQGADVALLVRRLREASGSDDLRCVGTSATLSTEGSHADRQAKVADVASLLFGDRSEPTMSSARRCSESPPTTTSPTPRSCRRSPNGSVRAPSRRPTSTPSSATRCRSGSSRRSVSASVDDRVVRAIPSAIDGPKAGAAQLEALTGVEQNRCREMIREQLMAGYDVANPTTGFPVFAFRLHQFLSRGDTVYASPESADVPVPHARPAAVRARRPQPHAAPARVLPGVRPGLLRRATGSPRHRHTTRAPRPRRDGRHRGHDVRVPLHVRRPAVARRRRRSAPPDPRRLGRRARPHPLQPQERGPPPHRDPPRRRTRQRTTTIRRPRHGGRRPRSGSARPAASPTPAASAATSAG